MFPEVRELPQVTALRRFGITRLTSLLIALF